MLDYRMDFLREILISTQAGLMGGVKATCTGDPIRITTFTTIHSRYTRMCESMVVREVKEVFKLNLQR